MKRKSPSQYLFFTILLLLVGLVAFTTSFAGSVTGASVSKDDSFIDKYVDSAKEIVTKYLEPTKSAPPSTQQLPIEEKPKAPVQESSFSSSENTKQDLTQEKIPPQESASTKPFTLPDGTTGEPREQPPSGGGGSGGGFGTTFGLTPVCQEISTTTLIPNSYPTRNNTLLTGNEACALIKDSRGLPYNCTSGIVQTTRVFYSTRDNTCINYQANETVLTPPVPSACERKFLNPNIDTSICEIFDDPAGSPITHGAAEPAQGDVRSKRELFSVLCCKVE